MSIEHLTDDMREQIKKHLPSMVSEELQTYLAEADKAVGQNEQQAIELSEGKKKIKELEVRLVTIGERESTCEQRERDLTARAQTIAAREQKLELIELELRLTNEKLELAKELYRIPFQNRVLRESLMTNESKSVPTNNQYGMQHNNEHTTRNEMRSITEE